ncbi:hypothetical protein [Tsukamurella sp. 1534]|uniref:hypothetical protein n=1 Tax=Tsukamurella sp. 1534 TaxID=1151061 RepID=UPI0002D2993F|nr:hypothetical protein [Tsukamurella sp. 1534]
MPTLPPETPGWIVLAVAAAVGLKYLAQFLSEASESVAKVLGPLARRWRERGEARMKERADTDQRRVSSMESDLEYFEKRAEASDKTLRHFMAWYARCDQPFHRELTIRAAEAGCDLPDWEPLSRWREPETAGSE